MMELPQSRETGSLHAPPGAVGKCAMHQLTGRIGRQAIHTANHLLNMFALTGRILASARERDRQGAALVRKIVTEQIYFTAVQALPVLVPVALITGSAILVQFSRISLQIDLGKLMVILLVREIGPGLTALLVILRSATSVTIETGYMNVLKEIETIEMTGIDPLRYIALPRLVGIISAIVSLFVIFDLISIIGGYALVRVLTELPVNSFMVQIGKALTATDIMVGLIKAVCFGVVITVTCLYHGFTPKAGFTEIPAATSRAAMECFFFCLVINGIISLLFYI